MARAVLLLILLALPAVLWFAWRRRTAPGGSAGEAWRDAPWHWLALAGVVVVALALATLVLLPGA